ncbi:S8 family peptidase [Salmonella enterica]|uniref:S8 family peptidase n=1 Tax=Citrobacter freundii TaxID=546 RepID=UPI001B36464C|nr:S8 family peptidase [Citrobacter freundii]EHO4421627.1 S8 family peptidase [Salmonella enterica]HDX8776047.1 S8 family peptidase [Klebsiella oxytoca]EIL1869123.1 S8 family peptidase [Salmonella enterica]EKU4665056.1 S8 family peptidase [Citrobacter freundii]ELH4154204.1 S8 family peptidase [Salmonella enterica]
MNNNPIQIVMNTSEYVDLNIPDPNGRNKEFFPHQDEAFLRHKNEILSAIGDIKTSLNKKDIKAVFAHVSLQPAAWAKSHRPIKSIFKSAVVPYVAGDDIGEMIVEINANNIDTVIKAIENAENETREKRNKKTGELECSPSRNRSEVGAIGSIREHDESDKRKFSIESAFNWLKNPDCGKCYFFELFSLGEKQDFTHTKVEQLQSDFESSLKLLSLDYKKYIKQGKNNRGIFYVVFLSNQLNDSLSFHKNLLQALGQHDAVKKIYLPPLVTVSQDIIFGNQLSNKIELEIEPDVDYPIVGIVDTGVSSIANLDDWRVAGSDFIMSKEQDRSHGTFIAGLIAGGSVINPNLEMLNETPCKFYDLDLYPTNKSNFSENYPRGFIDFLRQLDAEVQEAKNHGVRIFNMSLSLLTPVEDDSYSFYASMIDDISEAHDVIFVLPAGNLTQQLLRDSWPDTHTEALGMLAKYRYQGKDKLLQPCESIRSISVGALDSTDNIKKLKPSQYTRRGPGPSLGVKPDVCHIGGSMNQDTGLYSLSPSGKIISGCGTSYAAPLVAKTLAVLDKQIAGYVSREVLYGMLIHHAQIPHLLKKKELREVSRDFVGFGLPPAANDIVLYDDSTITIVLTGKLTHPYDELSFDFTWPKSLTDDEGKCRGNVSMTLVYSPYCDTRFGHEFIRLNLDACLRQAQISEITDNVTYKGIPKDSVKSSYEEELIKNGLKWWPTKKFNWNLKGKGNSSAWKIVVESLLRGDVSFPADGVPFSVLFTITDPKKGGFVFNEVRTSLLSSGVNISDIRTSNVLRNRG